MAKNFINYKFKETFKASKGWFEKFIRRNGIFHIYQKKNDKKF